MPVEGRKRAREGEGVGEEREGEVEKRGVFEVSVIALPSYHFYHVYYWLEYEGVYYVDWRYSEGGAEGVGYGRHACDNAGDGGCEDEDA